MPTDSAYRYDVAISLLAQDLDDARTIADEIRKRVRGEVFLYERRQEELAIAGDLVEEFTRVFAKQARAVVVLYRSRWGNTPYTSIEKEAIQSRRTRTTSYRFALIVSMAPEEERAPEWYPTSSLCMDLKNFTPEGIARVVAQRVEEMGGVTGAENLEEKHQRLQQQQARRDELRWRVEAEGPLQLEREATALFALLKQKARDFTELGPEPMQYVERERLCSVSYRWPALVVEWRRPVANRLADSGLTVAVRTVDPLTSMHRDQSGLPSDRALLGAYFQIAVDETGAWGWRSEKESRELRKGEFFTTTELAEWGLGHLLDCGHRDAPSPRRRDVPRRGRRPRGNGWVNNW